MITAVKSYTKLVGVLLTASVLILTSSVTSRAHDYVPGAPQSHPILLKGGDLYTVSQGVMEATDLLFVDGKISQIGKNLSAPENTEIIDVTGLKVYPGLIEPYSSLGLIEVGNVRATYDLDEVGSVNPEVSAHMAYNPDSELPPTIRSNGITTAVIAPRGGLIAGRASLIELDGWTKQDAMIVKDLALILDWPNVGISSRSRQSAAEQRKSQAEARDRLYDLFRDAQAYDEAKDAGRKIDTDLRWEAMRPVFDGSMPIFVSCGDYRQIDQAIAFTDQFKVKIIIVGGREAWMIADRLADRKIPVILNRTQLNPQRQDYQYDMSFVIPKKLYDAGVKFCFTNASGNTATWDAKNLPFQAGQAVAFGLPKDVALRALTLTTAEILGVADRLGSLDIGKSATIIVSEGDVMDQLTNQVVYEFMEGRKIDLSNKHKELYEKYKQKSLSQP